MAVESGVSKVGLLSLAQNAKARKRSSTLKVLGGWAIGISGVFFINMLVFTGLCFGYSNSVSKCHTEIIIVLLGISVVQAVLGLLSANKLFALRSENLYKNYMHEMKPLTVVNSILSLLSASHAVTCALMFLGAPSEGGVNLVVNTRTIGEAPLTITAISLVAVSTLFFFTSAISIVIAACHVPSKYDTYVASGTKESMNALLPQPVTNHILG